MPGSAPSGLARIMITSASTFEQNHLSPHNVTISPGTPLPPFARVLICPTSLPPCFSVRNMAPVKTWSMFVVPRRGMKRAFSSGVPNFCSRYAAPSVMQMGQ